jgi:hypothetical protein
MRRILLVLAVALLSLVVPTATALAQGEGPPLNEHNCGGVSSFVTLSEEGGQGFGELVSTGYAQEQTIDNNTQANCGETPRQNP